MTKPNTEPKVPIVMDIEFLKPIAIWYSVMPLSQKKDLAPRVANAMDSLYEIMKGRL